MALCSARRICYVCVEYCRADLYSGHGVCARAQVRALAHQGVSVLVMCARPRPIAEPDPQRSGINILFVPLDSWGNTERDSPHAQYASRAAAMLFDRVNMDEFEAFLAIDWTGINVLRAFVRRGGRLRAPVIYLNFRVYSAISPNRRAERAFYLEEEMAAVRFAMDNDGGIVALSEADEHSLRMMDPRDEIPTLAQDGPRYVVVEPMLRQEFVKISTQQEDHILDFKRKRKYLVSVVSLSEDKGAHRYVKLLQTLQNADPEFWERTGVTPVLCGESTQPEYAEKVKRELRETVPNAIIKDGFLSPTELAEVLMDSVVNVHPAVREAYGVTIVEAAAMGCPTVLNKRHVGATQMLPPRHNASVTADVTNRRAFANAVRKLIENKTTRDRLAYSAFVRATSWSETEHAQALMAFTDARIRRYKR